MRNPEGLWSGSLIWCGHLVQISVNLNKNWRCWHIWRKISQNVNFVRFFLKRSYQNRKLQNAITFERKLILTFCKKPLFSLIEILQINQTWIFWPGPPLSPLIVGMITLAFSMELQGCRRQNLISISFHINICYVYLSW